MRDIPSTCEIHQLTRNDNPDEVWAKTVGIIRHINPAYDFELTRAAFLDVLCLFRGEFPGYCAIKTPYHDLRHTMDVFLCSVRLMHGVHLSGKKLQNHEITLIMLATLLHDIGYAQSQHENSGTGAQFTLTHVGRGIQFMKNYLAEHAYPAEFAVPLECLMNSTNPGIAFDEINFPDKRTRLLAQIVGSADIVGQMSDRTYLEKLLFLFLEFSEANFGNYSSLHDLLSQTKSFYENTRDKKLEGAFKGIYKNLNLHFRAVHGIDKNYYLESIEKNIDYLSKVIALDETEYLSMLKRRGFIDLSHNLLVPHELSS